MEIRPGSQEGLVGNGEPAHSLVEDAVSGAVCPFLTLAAARLSPCLLWGMGRFAAG